MKVLVTGVNGLLGKDIARIFLRETEHEVIGVGRAECKNKEIKYYKVNLTDEIQLKKEIYDIAPDLIIHCAAYTKLDDCEKNNEYAYKMNVGVTKLLAEDAKRFVYMSSDAIFSGNKGYYVETDESDAINYYGYTKFQGEKAAETCPQSLIIRSSIYGYNLNDSQSIAEWGINSLMDRTSINGFWDVVFNPLYSRQLALQMLELIERNCSGIYHVGSEHALSKYEFFKEIARQLNVDSSLVKPKSLNEMHFLAKRTKNTSLCTNKVKQIYSCNNDIGEGISQMLCDMKQDGKI